MTCKECYYFEACQYWLNKENKKLGSVEGFICSHFKNKLLVVDLPCKAGDVLFVKEYNVETGKEYIEKVKCNEIEIIEDGISIICKTIEGNYNTYVLEDFGNCIFTTREEAEKALEEQTDDV